MRFTKIIAFRSCQLLEFIGLATQNIIIKFPSNLASTRIFRKLLYAILSFNDRMPNYKQNVFCCIYIYIILEQKTANLIII